MVVANSQELVLVDEGNSHVRTYDSWGQGMLLLHVIASVDPSYGGPIEGVFRQAQVHRELGTTVEIVSLDEADDPWVRQCPIKTYALGEKSRLGNFGKRYVPWLRYGYTPRLTKWLKENVGLYDAVVINGLWRYPSVAAWQVLRKTKIPYFVFTHGMLDPWFRDTYPFKHVAKQALWLIGEGRALADARATLFTTEEERERARGVFWGHHYNAHVIGYGTADVQGNPEEQIAAFHQATGLPRGQRFLLFMSRIHQKKGCDLLIDAFAAIAHRHPDLILVMGGPDQVGWVKDLRHQAERAGIADRLMWPGMLQGDVKWGALRSTEAMVLPSHQENFGIVVAEALACHAPVLISNKVNIWREVEASGAGLVAEDDAEGTQALLEEFLALDDAEKMRMRACARHCFESHFNVRRTVSDLTKLIHQAGRQSELVADRVA